MENRHKGGLRPRPNLAPMSGAVTGPDYSGDFQYGWPRSLRRNAPAAKRPSVMQAPVLVLNATFEPINVTAVRRALVLMLKGVAQAEETNHPRSTRRRRRSRCRP